MRLAARSRRTGWRIRRIGVVPAVLGVLVLGAMLVGQSREAYQKAYRDWRATDPNLERDAAKEGDALAPRAEKAAAAVGKFIAEHQAFYDSQRDDLAEKLKMLQPFELPKENQGAKTAEAYVATQEATITTSIDVFGNDPDKGIQQLRQTLERERQALIAVRGAIKASESATDAVNQANEGAERARSTAAEEIKALSASFAQSDQAAGQLAEAWPAYYRSLARGAHGIGAVDAPPLAIRASNSAPSATPAAPVASVRAIPSVPVSRYTGTWTFLPGVSTYHGMAPVSFDVLVREDGGQISGTVSASFIVSDKTDPNVRFDFSGPMQTARFQAFPLKTAEGAKGKVELIPGNAFNLLEVNYTFDGAPTKVKESDVILVKH